MGDERFKVLLEELEEVRILSGGGKRINDVIDTLTQFRYRL